ncbi:hypothetical protein GF391_01200 [Candidatus Uhrbacteria bacterium]|nr:hypothetical protein [Candidatus Uhrbacteria bacterium]
MKTRGILWISAAVLIFALFSVWIRLPLVSSNIWMSPDETANIITAINFSEHGSFGYSSEITQKFIWAHPRSFVFVPETGLVAPIGFLGMPLVLSFIYKLFGLLGLNFFAPLLALTTLYPLWRVMPKTWPKPVKFMSIIIWMSLPTVILYTNRGTFPQLTQLCLMVWAWFLLTRTSRPKLDATLAQNSEQGTPNEFSTKTKINYRELFNKFSSPIAGILSALALIIRPVEAIWIIPVIIFAFIQRTKLGVRSSEFRVRPLLVFIIPFILILLVSAKLGADTYGKWFVSGYQIRPITTNYEQRITNNDLDQNKEDDVGVQVAHSDSVSFFDTLPFSFHPRHIWWNIKNYYFWLLLPWTVLALGSILILTKEKVWQSENKWALAAVIWPVIATTLFYGNGIYQDHVRLNEVSLGNSFLRYTLPVSIAVALSAGYVFSKLWRPWSTKIFAVCLTAGLAVYGMWIAVAGYDESLIYIEQELYSYRQVRAAAQKDFPGHGIILSDRSDKIFFPVVSAVSPMPSHEQINILQKESPDLRLYLPTQDSQGIEDWEKQGFILRPVFTTGNQTLYDVY